MEKKHRSRVSTDIAYKLRMERRMSRVEGMLYILVTLNGLELLNNVVAYVRAR